MPALSDEEIRKLAKDRVGWRIHALVYVAVNVLLNAVWWMTSGFGAPTLDGGRSYYWPVWPLLGWGIGLAIHGFVAYGGGRDWEAREVEKLRGKYGRP